MVAECLNDFFINVAKDIGNVTVVDKNHPSIIEINKKKKKDIPNLEFKEISDEFVHNQINKTNVKKATGRDGISAKLLKLAKPVIAKPITKMINKTITNSVFPDQLKIAQVVALHKKNNALDKSNYRPVSILPVISKFFEWAIHEQLTEYFNNHFHPFLSAFRSGYGCNTTLLKIIEDWKQALDQNKYIAAVLMDTSKAFDCLPHKLLLLKLEAYGMSKSALQLIENYLTNRKQCVKVGTTLSNWQDIYKGVPQGSILGPVLFNIFLNNIFHFTTSSTLYNYADDNTLAHADDNIDKVVEHLEKDSLALIEWFSCNQMKANPDKFQAIAIGKKSMDKNIVLDLAGNKIKCEKEVKLLGVTIDFELKFNSHISNICKKASRQLNVLKRLGKYLNKLGKLTIYHSFILSNFNFCPLSWHFCNEANTNKIEKIQERALRFIYNDYNSTYENLLIVSKLPTLKVRRLRTMAIEVYKIIHQESPSYLHDLIKIKDTKYCFRYDNITEIPSVRTTRYGLKTFRYAAAKLWNELPNHFRTQTSFNQFKNLINSWNGNSCRCNSCC